jgi:hypothetical protein
MAATKVRGLVAALNSTGYFKYKVNCRLKFCGGSHTIFIQSPDAVVDFLVVGGGPSRAIFVAR